MLAVFISDPQLVRQAFSRPVFSGRAPLYLTHGIMKGHGLTQFNYIINYS
jgi:ecdysteroid 25-hydroxylase CYP306A1